MHICPEESSYITALCDAFYSLSPSHTLFHLPNAQVKHKQKGTCPLGSACVLEKRWSDKTFCRRERCMTILCEPLYKGCHRALSSCGAFTPHRVRREWVFTHLSPSSSALVSLALPLLLRCLVFQLTSVGSVAFRRPVRREQAGTLWKIESLICSPAVARTIPSCPALSSSAMWLLDWIVSLNTAVVKLASGLRCKWVCVCVCVAEVVLLTYWCWIKF